MREDGFGHQGAGASLLLNRKASSRARRSLFIGRMASREPGSTPGGRIRVHGPICSNGSSCIATSSRNSKTPKRPKFPSSPTMARISRKPQMEPSITCVGHCGFIIQDGPSVILTDPHFGARGFLVSTPSTPGRACYLGAGGRRGDDLPQPLRSSRFMDDREPARRRHVVRARGAGRFRGITRPARRGTRLVAKRGARRRARNLPARAALVEPLRHGEGLHALVRLAHRDRYAQVFSRRGQRLFSRV